MAAAMGIVASASTVTGQQDANASLTFEKQESDGRTVTIAAISTDVDSTLLVSENRSGDQEERLYARRDVPAGTDETDLVVELERPIEETKTIKVLLFDDTDEIVARETASVAIGEEVDTIGVTFVEAKPDAGFHYPYYLYNPTTNRESELPILVEPNNTGTSTDDFEKHRERARQIVERGGISRDISDELGTPLLVPVFPRPQSDPVDGLHYTHQLDRDTLRIDDGPLERIDLQLLRMVEHAADRLTEAGRSIDDRIIMNGFSASGNFVDRFAVLHPERVLSVTAGGLNGMVLLPLAEAKGHTLNYHIGIADLAELTGTAPDIAALNEVNQFLFMGAEDTNDTIPYDDAWTSESMRQTALAVYGEDMIEDRFPFCQEAYVETGVDAQFRIYDGTGHTPRPAKEDILTFHRRSIEGKDVSDFGEDLSSWSSDASDGDGAGTTNDDAEPGGSGNDGRGPGFLPGLAIGFGVGAFTAGMAFFSYFKDRLRGDA